MREKSFRLFTDMTPPLMKDKKGMKNKGLTWAGYSFQGRGRRGTVGSLT